MGVLWVRTTWTRPRPQPTPQKQNAEEPFGPSALSLFRPRPLGNRDRVQTVVVVPRVDPALAAGRRREAEGEEDVLLVRRQDDGVANIRLLNERRRGRALGDVDGRDVRRP